MLGSYPAFELHRLTQNSSVKRSVHKLNWICVGIPGGLLSPWILTLVVLLGLFISSGEVMKSEILLYMAKYWESWSVFCLFCLFVCFIFIWWKFPLTAISVCEEDEDISGEMDGSLNLLGEDYVVSWNPSPLRLHPSHLFWDCHCQ